MPGLVELFSTNREKHASTNGEKVGAEKYRLPRDDLLKCQSLWCQVPLLKWVGRSSSIYTPRES